MSVDYPIPSGTVLCSACFATLDDPRPSIASIEGYGNCLTLKHLAEKADIRFYAALPDKPSIGDHNSHINKLTNDSGAWIGTINGAGWKVYERPQDRHVMSYYREEIELTNGTVHTSGWLDSTAVWAGQWQSLHAVGTSGVYLGKIGVRQIRQEIPRKLFRTNIVLCDSVSTHR